jgi:hypothetical protein
MYACPEIEMQKCCKVCGKKVSGVNTYCNACLNDPTPLKQMMAQQKISQQMMGQSYRSYGTNKGSQKSRLPLLIVASLCVGAFVLFHPPQHQSPQQSPPAQNSTAVNISTTPNQAKASTSTQRLGSELSATSPSKTVPDESKSTPEAHIIENLAAALTVEYRSTPYEVRVFGDDSEGSLSFDCSDDPHSEDVCLMLYKQYPDSRERKVLRMMHIRKLYFHAGLMKKSWGKNL